MSDKQAGFMLVGWFLGIVVAGAVGSYYVPDPNTLFALAFCMLVGSSFAIIGYEVGR